MKTFLCATLAALLVAAVTAQSSEQPHDASAIQELVEKINTVVGSLGGFDGAINKLEYITQLVQKAYNDKGIGGWMARNLIKLELGQLKEKALHTEKDMINNLLDQLEVKAGLHNYSVGEFILGEAVKKAIALIRESIQQIISEINKAQMEHDEAAGKVSQDAMKKINDHLQTAKEKLKNLTKKLFDKLTGRDKTAEVYGADGGIRYAISNYGGIRYQAPGENYIFSEMIKVAAEQLRERIFKYIEAIGEAKRAAQKELGKNKELALGHLQKLNERLRQALADLKDTLLGKKTTEELEEEIKEGVEINEAVLFMGQTYGLEDVRAREEKIRNIIKELQEKFLENIKQLENAKHVADELSEAKYTAVDQAVREKKIRDTIRDLREKILENIKELEKAKRVAEELQKDQESERAVMSSANYMFDDAVKELVGKLRVRIMQLIEQLGNAKREAEKAVGDARKTAREELRKLRQQLRKLTKDLRDAILGRQNKEELEKDLEPTTEAAVPSA